MVNYLFVHFDVEAVRHLIILGNYVKKELSLMRQDTMSHDLIRKNSD